jgi:site-specific DNA-cytosine methylase
MILNTNVDTTKTITHISLCSGYGGIDMGLKRVIPTLRTIAYSEREAFVCANLVSKMEKGLLDPAPIWSDLKTFPWSEFRNKVDIISGGYPCQPFSHAGQRKGAEDERHLWPFIREGIRQMQPAMCFWENVEGHITIGLSTVISDLEEDGYQCSWGIFSASEVGCVHQRKRVFILAHNNNFGSRESWVLRQGSNGSVIECNGKQRGIELADSEFNRLQRGSQSTNRNSERKVCEQKEIGSNIRSKVSGCSRDTEDELANSEDIGRDRGITTNGDDQQGVSVIEGKIRPILWSEVEGCCGDPAQPARPGQEQYSWEPPRVVTKIKPPLGGSNYGGTSGVGYAELCHSMDNRTDELRLLGNGVVPATAARAFLTLSKKLFND